MIGSIGMTDHFRDRCRERDFTTLDAQELVENGQISNGPIYDSDYHTWKCEFVGRIDTKQWKLVIALACDSDLCEAPQVTLVTVHRSKVKGQESKRG
jgi:hypothetical protein